MNEEYLQALATLAKFAPATGVQKDEESELGFCDPPRLGRAVYVDDETGSFYYFHMDKPKNEQKEILPKKAIKGYIKGLRLVTKEYKGKESMKVRVDLVADQQYMLEKGTNTNFARDLLLYLAEAGTSIKDVVTIEVSEPPEKQEKTCFCNLYTVNGQVKIEDKSVYKKENKEYLEALVQQINNNLK